MNNYCQRMKQISWQPNPWLTTEAKKLFEEFPVSSWLDDFFFNIKKEAYLWNLCHLSKQDCYQ